VLATAIRWAGGAFLLWLALGCLRSAWRGGADDGPTAAPAGGGFWTGLTLMLLNAKAGFFWVSLTGVFLGTDLPAATALLAVGVSVALSLGWHGLLAFAFSDRRLTGIYRRARRGIEGVFGAVLGGLGVRLLAAS
jgi:threonine/homoserine/homoserine lactone efflux protein